MSKNACLRAPRLPYPFRLEGLEDEAFSRRPCDDCEPGAP